jgi:hypothetical protein
MSIFEMLSLFFSVIGLASALERAFYIFSLNINAGEFMKQIIKLVSADNIDRAIKLCGVAAKGIVAQRTMKVLEAYMGGVREKDKLRDIFYGSNQGEAKTKVVNLGFMKVNMTNDDSEFDQVLNKRRKRFYSSIVVLILATIFWALSPKPLEIMEIILPAIFLLILQPTIQTMKIRRTSKNALDAFLEQFGQ